MDANRSSYLAAKEDFEQLVQTVIDKFGKTDADIASLQVKDCVFRLNRDVRFSKDKSPYKTNFGASFARGGKKVMNAGYYFQLQPGNSFIGGGLWMPMPPELKKIRQEIDYNYTDFKKIVSSKKFTTQYDGLERSADMVLSRPPKGYDDANPAIEFIKLKSFVATRPVAESILTGKDLVKEIITAFQALQPLVAFLNGGLA